MFANFTPTRNLKYLAVCVLSCVAFAGIGAKADDDRGVDYFEKHVRPLLVERCLKCHSEGSESIGGNLLLDSRQGWMQGGDLGPAIKPGEPQDSLLFQAVSGASDELEMPPDGKLSKHEIGILKRWIELGSPDPRNKLVKKKEGINVEDGKKFWAFQSPHERIIQVPPSSGDLVALNELDRFVHRQQIEKGIRPVAPASKRVLIRRVTLDLTGLLPEPNEVEQFLQDDSPNAYEKLVDRLLASPRYGEKWGRHWLDVARYADSNGLDENIAHGNAWRFRDYVIRSFNLDKPFSQFVREQVAGDLIETASSEVSSERFDSIIATGFLSLGPKVLAEVDETKMEMDIVDEQVDTVGRAFMGMTFGCARCHDHKFDPVRTEDYYALAGIFKSTRTMEHFKKIARWNEVPLATPSELKSREEKEKRVALEKQKLDERKKKLSELKIENEQNELKKEIAQQEQVVKQLEQQLLPLPTAMGVSDYSQPVNVSVHIRGSHLTLGKEVARGVPQVLGEPDSIPAEASGRKELANWMTDGKHPLVARVIVNRVWRWHFGRGIVGSTDNFGILGNRPSHPELLDWLAQRFVSDGWSIKSLHRLILTSATYQLSTENDPANEQKDRDNVYFWRAELRRMEAESLRDSLLQVAGMVNYRMGGSQLHVKNRAFLFDHTSKDLTRYDALTRSVYLPVIRNNLYDAFQLFDYSDASVAKSNRSSTTVAPQALFMMNSPLVIQAAKGFAERLLKGESDKRARLKQAYLIAFGRQPELREIERDLQFISRLLDTGISQEDALQQLCHAMLMSNEFVFLR